MNKINKVAIFGMGKSGKSALKLAKKYRQDFYAVNKGDPRTWWQEEDLKDICGICACSSEEDFAPHFEKMDEIVISPGIPTTHPVLKNAVQKGVPIISEIEYAYRYAKDIPVIAITGTNGKTTTTTMIAQALTLFGKKVFCGGNIGTPFCELPVSDEKVDFSVIEVSSFQLETTKEFHPCIGLILNIFPNHSERYDQVIDYARAKFRLLNNMTAQDHIILGTENPYLNEIETHPVTKSFFTKGALPEDFRKQFDFSKSKVKGEHNEANFYATFEVLRLLGFKNLNELFQKFIDTFPGVAHRLEFVFESEGLSIYNDAKSTNSLATTTAIRAFKDVPGPLYLILGGKLRNESDKFLPDLLPYKDVVKKIFTIGEVTERLYHELGDHFDVEKAWDLKTVFEKVRGLKGNLVFSPGFPSFDQFKNYVDRGEKFKISAREGLL
jgi:UDP-N-acetylmuramoylalanine--D-glutamate ligase